jgi:hypothetical protein
LGILFKSLNNFNITSVYLIDSSPVAICKNIRICNAKLVKVKEFRGYNASKESIFIVLKRSDVSLHVVTTGEGIPVEFLVTAGSIADNTTFQVMDINLPDNGDLYGDAAYIS